MSDCTGRKWRSHPFGKGSSEQLTRSTVIGKYVQGQHVHRGVRGAALALVFRHSKTSLFVHLHCHTRARRRGGYESVPNSGPGFGNAEVTVFRPFPVGWAEHLSLQRPHCSRKTLLSLKLRPSSKKILYHVSIRCESARSCWKPVGQYRGTSLVNKKRHPPRTLP